MTPLLFAVGRDPINLDVIKELLKRGADVNTGDAENASPLLYLLTRRHELNITAMTMLLENGADVNVRGYCCNSAALHHALLRPDCDEDMIHLLLQHGAEVNAVDNAQYTPLHYAVIKFVKGSSHFEIRYGDWLFRGHEDWADLVSPHFKQDDKECNERIVEELLLWGALVDAVNDFDETALHLAVRNPNCSANVIRLLLQNEANVNAECHLNLTPLLYAVQVKWDNESVIAELLEGGANPNIRCNKEISALHHAVRNRFCTLNVTKALLSRGAVVDHPDIKLSTPLHYAVVKVEQFKVDHIKELLKNGACADAEDVSSITPLEFALQSYRCTAELVRLLLKSQKSSADLRLFLFCVVTSARHSLDVREEILNHGIDVHCQGNGLTVLDKALEDVCRYQSSVVDGMKRLHDRTDWVRLLLQKGYYVTNSCIWERVIKRLLEDNTYLSEEAKAFEFLKFITKYVLLEIPGEIEFSSCAKTHRISVEIPVEEDERWFTATVPATSSSGCSLSCSYSSRLSQFQRDCLAEIQAMERIPYSERVSLLAFLGSQKVCQEKLTVKELFRTLSSGQLPIYSEVIANRMDRAALIDMLMEEKIPLTVAPGDPSPVLAPNCVYKIANYLPNEDIMKCIFAFSHRQL